MTSRCAPTEAALSPDPDIFATANGTLIDYTGTVTATSFIAAPQAGATRILYTAGAAGFTAGANLLINGVASGETYFALAGEKIEATAITTTITLLNMTQRTASGKLPVITAPVNANALTIGVSSQYIEFRNGTLASGNSSTLFATPANLVVPSGATLGSTNGVQSRLVVLEINNAGTAEIAVVNASCGLDLSETGLISTAAISGLATSITTVYSTTARLSVAYRVIGYIESAQATAGTWATNPTVIQGLANNLPIQNANFAGASGYIRLGNVLMQWGYATTVASVVTVTYPIPFQYVVRNVSLTCNDSARTPAGSVNNSPGLTSFQILATVTDTSFYWSAIGV